MRGIGRVPPSRLSLIRSLIAALACLTGASLPVAQAQTSRVGAADETAMAIPRAHPPEGGAAPLPQPLAPSEAGRIRRIFALQAEGDFGEAERQTARLSDTTLLGHILADRYLGRSYQPNVGELAAWLARYPTLPDAPAVFAALKRRAPKRAAREATPVLDRLADASNPATPPEADPALPRIARNPLLDRAVSGYAEAGNTQAARALIARTKPREPAYAALLEAEVARSLFDRNDDAAALEVAGNAVRDVSEAGQPVLAGYIAGLAAWRLGRPDLARDNFEAAAKAGYGTAALRAAAAFWAARAHLRAGDAPGFVPWMRRAADEPNSFYGQLARRTLGMSGGFAWTRETASEADIAAVAATPEGLRAFALLEVGQSDRAEQELRLLWPAARDHAGLQNAMLLVAREAALTDLAAQLAPLVQAEGGTASDVDRFAVPKLRPRSGFSVDPALIYGLTRVESNFNATAVSPTGALGLMQLMPVTAGFIADDPSLARRGGRLRDPALNLELGQQYIAYLARQDGIADDLIRLLASYNAGPGSLERWAGAVHDEDDPLLFIEAIPIDQTRRFVHDALAYSWIYAERLGLPAPGLNQLAAGAFPRFTPLGKTEKIGEPAPRTDARPCWPRRC
ncbi:MAG: transglycosylase SLT domain-containing protein [Alphaproteobacteria bacterium]|nr:transglycosylase SLT domain-containing protein [Alphaproteobacteria bacterium]